MLLGYQLTNALLMEFASAAGGSLAKAIDGKTTTTAIQMTRFMEHHLPGCLLAITGLLFL